MTRAGLGGQSVFADLVDVAAAHLFHLCSNYPFVDGNRGTALAAGIVLLKLNRACPAPDSEHWESPVLDVALGKLDRRLTTTRLRELAG